MNGTALIMKARRLRLPIHEDAPMIIRTCVLLAVAFSLGACVTEPVGDFGRKEESVFHDTILGGAGRMAAFNREEAVSTYQLTDEEKELRDVAWDLIRPPYGGGSFNSDFKFTLAWSRIRPQAWYEYDAADFYRYLRSDGLLSHETYYERIIAQARSDASRLPVFRDVAVRVGKGDGARRSALRALDANAEMKHDAEARIFENGQVVAWVEHSLQQRILAYRTALGRLMIEMPSTKAVDAEAAIDALAWEVGGTTHVTTVTRTTVHEHEGFMPQGEVAK